MKILSFDVGIKNLAYCLVENTTILEWNIIDITAKNNANACSHMVNLLDSCNNILNSDLVLIEKQPSKNNKMRIVEGLLNAYFVIRGMNNTESSIQDVIVYSAKHKLGKDTFKGKSNYSQRKKLGIFRCNAFLKQIKQSEQFENLFDKSNKKDDLADCLLQALSYTNFHIDCNTELFSFNEKIISRKPSKKQERSRYSKCNLKWFLKEFIKKGHDKNYIIDRFNNEPKLQTSIKYWYKSPELAYNILNA